MSMLNCPAFSQQYQKKNVSYSSLVFFPINILRCHLFENISHPLIAKLQWQKIAQGSSNTLYRASDAQMHYILRINASDEFAFGVNRGREGKVLALIADQAWAPRIFENNMRQGWCLMQGYGSCVSVGEATSDKVWHWYRQLLSCSEKLALNPLVNSGYIDFDYQYLMSCYMSIFERSKETALPLELCQLLNSKIAQLPEVTKCLVHQDLHCGNVLHLLNNPLENSEIVVIDWEYAGWGLPWLDIAALYTVFKIAADKLHSLAVVNHLNGSEFARGLALAKLINRALACIWYWVRFSSKQDTESNTDPYSKSQLAVQAQYLIDELQAR